MHGGARTHHLFGFGALLRRAGRVRAGDRALEVDGQQDVAGGVGTLLGPWLAGVAYDAVGSYQLAMLGGALFSAGAAACVAILMHGGQAKAFHRG